MSTSALAQLINPHRPYLNLGLWTCQLALALFFVLAGFAKLTQSMESLTLLMPWPSLASPGFVRGLGMAELVMGLMVLSPLVSWRVGRPILLLATAGIMALEIIMLMLHLTDMNIELALANLILLGLTLPVFWFRRHV